MTQEASNTPKSTRKAKEWLILGPVLLLLVLSMPVPVWAVP